MATVKFRSGMWLPRVFCRYHGLSVAVFLEDERVDEIFVAVPLELP
jgi:hypothetical protein